MQQLLHSFDKHLTLAVQQLPLWLTPVMKAATLIGQPVIIIFLALLAATVGWVKGFPRLAYAQLAALAALGGNAILKQAVHRARPDTLYAGSMHIKSYSFPSGHAFGAIVFYGLWAYLAYNHLPRPWNVITALLLSVLILLIGVSRVFLGAHFPSDVAVGWLLGGICLLLIIKLIRP